MADAPSSLSGNAEGMTFSDLSKLGGEFIAQVAEFLENWPLYRRFVYPGNIVAFGELHHRKACLPFPYLLDRFCSKCSRTQKWEAVSPSRGAAAFPAVERYENTYDSFVYECRNCCEATVRFVLYIDVGPLFGELTKIGQWPPQTREPDSSITGGWTEHDLKLYRNALTLRNSTMGIGALVYLRRVIENRINDILRLISTTPDDIEDQDAEQKALSLQKLRRFTEKLDFAREHLPESLTPTGMSNPIGPLYDLVSDGLHSKSDEECIEVFDRCRIAFEYVVKKLSESRRADDEYLRAIRGLAKPTPKKK